MKPDPKEHQIELLQLMLPPDMFDYFDIMNVSSSDKTIDVFLDEKYHKPEKHKDEKLISKSFHQSVIIQDFPIRDWVVYFTCEMQKMDYRKYGGNNKQ
ncbi:hypothetical protein [uncultured Sunxiuqinia sp.]|uniref:ISAon1 family transposase N-terminal region protein n=1 Tax=uncultured Sunxiuqinia sp. TaxID=1573825 RepID=UPI002AA80D1B|nr:hypothetical protein [uncultured Sunxiuqinia sp.]